MRPAIIRANITGINTTIFSLIILILLLLNRTVSGSTRKVDTRVRTCVVVESAGFIFRRIHSNYETFSQKVNSLIHHR